MTYHNHMPATASSWAINDTANKTITFATGIIEAATSDDINPIALACCESFGSLLPLCTLTRSKVEKLARRNHTSHVLNFIKGQIGYKKGDSVEVLSRSDAGIRFLCLAATFCTLDHYDAANRLDALLNATQKEYQVRPTIKQLQVMMGTLKTKLALSEFAEMVAGYEILARSKLVDSGPAFRIDVAQVPSKDSLQELILAMNELERVGDVHAIEVKLRPQHLPWTWAFIKWCLGLEPMVRTADYKSLLPSKNSSMTLTVMPKGYRPRSRKRPHAAIDEAIEVAPQRRMQNIKDIIFPEEPNARNRYHGLVTMDTWVRCNFVKLHDQFPEIRKDTTLERAIGQALHFIIGTLPERLILCNDYNNLQTCMDETGRQSEHFLHHSSPKPFLDATTRLKIAQGQDKEHVALTDWKADGDTTLIPSNLAKRIPGACKQCRNPLQNDIVWGNLPCRVQQLLEAIGTIGCATLTSTLFGSLPEAYPMVLAELTFSTSQFHDCYYRLFNKTKRLEHESWPRLIITRWQALMREKDTFLSCTPIAIFKGAAKLLGHPEISDSTIISSNFGQVLFPAFFETQDFMQAGYMQLCAFPGGLIHNGMRFDFFEQAQNDDVILGEDSFDQYSQITSHGEDDDQSIGEVQSDEDFGSPASIENEEVEPSTALQMVTRRSIDASSRTEDASEIIRTEHIAHDALTAPEDTRSDVDVTMAEQEDAEAQRTEQKVPPSYSSSKRHAARPGSDMEWKVAVHDDLLRGELFLQDDDYPTMAWSLIECQARCRLTPACRHRWNTPAGLLGDEFELWNEVETISGSDSPMILFDVGRSPVGQLAALQQQQYCPVTVVHIDGCIRCALRMCLDGGCKWVIS